MDLFKYHIKTKTICDKEAYLLHELLKDIKYTNEKHDLETPIIEHASSLKRFSVQEYSNNIAFFPSGRYLFVHNIDITPCASIATLHGCDLRDTELTKAFGRMLKRKFHERKKGNITWPLTSEEFSYRICNRPLSDIYNVICFSIYESSSINQ